MKTIVIFDETIFGYKIVMTRDKVNDKKRYCVFSSYHVFNPSTSALCVTGDYNKAFRMYRFAISEIVDNEIIQYKKLHGYK